MQYSPLEVYKYWQAQFPSSSSTWLDASYIFTPRIKEIFADHPRTLPRSFSAVLSQANTNLLSVRLADSSLHPRNIYGRRMIDIRNESRGLGYRFVKNINKRLDQVELFVI